MSAVEPDMWRSNCTRYGPGLGAGAGLRPVLQNSEVSVVQRNCMDTRPRIQDDLLSTNSASVGRPSQKLCRDPARFQYNANERLSNALEILYWQQQILVASCSHTTAIYCYKAAGLQEFEICNL